MINTCLPPSSSWSLKETPALQKFLSFPLQDSLAFCNNEAFCNNALQAKATRKTPAVEQTGFIACCNERNTQHGGTMGHLGKRALKRIIGFGLVSVVSERIKEAGLFLVLDAVRKQE